MKLETVLKQDSGDFLWFHPRATAVPGDAGSTDVLMTIQKHLNISDYYSGLHFMTREGVNGHWTGPVLAPELDWKVQPDGVILSVADVTPGYHSPTGKVIDIGARLRYSPPGEAARGCVPHASDGVCRFSSPICWRWVARRTLPGRRRNCGWRPSPLTVRSIGRGKVCQQSSATRWP